MRRDTDVRLGLSSERRATPWKASLSAGPSAERLGPALTLSTGAGPEHRRTGIPRIRVLPPSRSGGGQRGGERGFARPLAIGEHQVIHANFGARRCGSRRPAQIHASPRSPVPQMTGRRSRSFDERGWPCVDRVRSFLGKVRTFDARQTRPVWSSGDEVRTAGLPRWRSIAWVRTRKESPEQWLREEA